MVILILLQQAHFLHKINSNALPFEPVSHDLLIALQITNREKRIMVDFRLFLNHFQRNPNLKGELTSELCFTDLNVWY